jgi:hypothetical protein
MAKGDAYHEFDPFKLTGVKPSKSRDSRDAALAEVADFVKESILNNCASGKTSIDGGLWKKKLTPEYKKEKLKESGVGFANLELHGDLLDSLDTKVAGKKIIIEITDSAELGKAEGNLIGSYGRDPNPDNAREFMPHKRGDRLTPEIMRGVKEILQQYEDDDGE